MRGGRPHDIDWRAHHLGAEHLQDLMPARRQPKCLQRFLARRLRAPDDGSAAIGDRSARIAVNQAGRLTVGVHQLMPAMASTITGHHAFFMIEIAASTS
jgi:hypothetical protein